MDLENDFSIEVSKEDDNKGRVKVGKLPMLESLEKEHVRRFLEEVECYTKKFASVMDVNISAGEKMLS